MLEIRSFEGSPEELANFVVRQWTASYGGRMAVPDWSGDYFRWQLRMDEPEQRRHVIAAYDGAQLAGVVPHFPMQFALDGEKFSASQASWLSVAPEFRGQGVAGKLIQGSRAIHRELGLRFQLGFAQSTTRAERIQPGTCRRRRRRIARVHHIPHPADHWTQEGAGRNSRSGSCFRTLPACPNRIAEFRTAFPETAGSHRGPEAACGRLSSQPVHGTRLAFPTLGFSCAGHLGR